MTPVMILAIPLILIAIVCAWRIAVMQSTEYEFHEGFVIIRSGVLTRRDRPILLHHIDGTYIEQGPINRMFGEGRLILRLDSSNGHRKITLHGLAPIHEMHEIGDLINQASRSLRNNPIIRGIIN